MNGLVVLAVAASALALGYLFIVKKSFNGLKPREYQDFKLIAKTDTVKATEGMHTMTFRFEVPEGKNIGLPIGQHILIKGKGADGKEFSRPYTPVSGDDARGYVDFIIKIYPNGQMGTYLKNLPIGSMVGLRGPTGHVKYANNGQFFLTKGGKEAAKTVKNVGMIAGGSGLTPMLQIIRHVAQRREVNKNINMALIFGNRTEKDIICREELEQISATDTNFHLWFTLDAPTDAWKQGRGYVTADMVKQNLPAPGNDTVILLCGPPPMCDGAIATMKKMGYTEDMFIVY